MKSSLVTWVDGIERVQHYRLRIRQYDLLRMSRERCEMIEDGLWLIEQALKDEHTDGPLALPKTGMLVRGHIERAP